MFVHGHAWVTNENLMDCLLHRPRSCDVMELLNHLASLAGETSTKELLGPVLHGAKTMAVQAHNGHAPAATAA